MMNNKDEVLLRIEMEYDDFKQRMLCMTNVDIYHSCQKIHFYVAMYQHLIELCETDSYYLHYLPKEDIIASLYAIYLSQSKPPISKKLLESLIECSIILKQYENV